MVIKTKESKIMKNIIIAGGLELAVGLAKSNKYNEFKVVLIDKEKTHIWKPHLHEVAAYLV